MKHIYSFFVLSFISLVISDLKSQTRGDFIVIGFDAVIGNGEMGGADKFTIIATTNFNNAGKEIYITDKGWQNAMAVEDGSNTDGQFVTIFNNEGTLLWTTPVLSRGDIIEFTVTPGTSATATVKVTSINNPSSDVDDGTVTVEEGWTDNTLSGSPLGQSGESIILYRGSLNNPSRFITAFTTRDFRADTTQALDNSGRTERPNDLDTDNKFYAQIDLNSTDPVSGATASRSFGRVKVPTGTDIDTSSTNNILNFARKAENWESADSSFDTSSNYYLNATLSTTDVKKLEAVSIYPNPTKGELNFNLLSNVIIENIEVYNSAGAIVVQSKENVNLVGLDSGLYFIKIQTSEGITLKKIMKE